MVIFITLVTIISNCLGHVLCFSPYPALQSRTNGGSQDWGSSWADAVGGTLSGLWGKAQSVASNAATTIQEQNVLESLKVAASSSAAWMGDKSRAAVSAVSVRTRNVTKICR